jgi:hypothetical protein
MRTNRDRVVTDLVVRLHQQGGPPVPLPATMSYDPHDPFAVTVDFHAGPDKVVTWRFARDLLRDGIDAPVGDGDVQVWPARLGAGPVSLKISTSGGQALFRLPRKKVTAFLARSYAAVPSGTESQNFDVEAFIATLAGGSAG